MSHTFINWARTFTSQARAACDPADEMEAARIVRQATAAGRRVRAVGAGHSWSDIAVPEDILLRLDRMRSVVSVDEAQGEVTVQAGIRLRELARALDARGLALSILGSVAEQSAAGAISTGTHGSSLRHGSLSSFVRAMRLVTANGEVLVLDASDERLDAARVGLGVLGVITEVTLACEPAFRLREVVEPVPLARVVRDLGAIAGSAEYVKVWWLPGTRMALVYRAERTDAPATHRPLARLIDAHVVNGLLFPALLGLARHLPAITPTMNRAVGAAYLRPSTRVDRADRVFNVAMPPRHREMEYAVPMERAAEALDRAIATIVRDRVRVNFIFEVRFARGDTGWMSPDFGRDSCHLGAYMAESPDLLRYFAGFEATMRAFGGRPHWGEELHATPADVRAVLPMADRFLALRDSLDPHGTFANAFTDRVLGPRRIAGYDDAGG